MTTRHLLTVWQPKVSQENRRSPQENPSYAEDALDAHLRVLLRWAERSRDPADAASPEEDVYVWWVKVRSPRRDGERPHAAPSHRRVELVDAYCSAEGVRSRTACLPLSAVVGRCRTSLSEDPCE